MSHLFLYGKNATGQGGAVFRSRLAAAVGLGDTSITLPTGDGAKLPAIPSGYAIGLRLGSDTDFDEVLVTGKSGDTLTCSAISREFWPLGTAIIMPVGALLLNNLVQRPELVGFATAAQGDKADSAVQPNDLGDAAFKDVGTTAGTVAAGDDSRFGTGSGVGAGQSVLLNRFFS